MDLGPLVEKKRLRRAHLEALMSDPAFFSDARAAGDVSREHRRIGELVHDWDVLQAARRELEQNRELARGEDDLAELAAEEIPALEATIDRLGHAVHYGLLPRDKAEDKDAILEIRGGAGGDEASLFASDLLRMYQRFAERRGWKTEVMEASLSEVGGFKEVRVKVTGEEVFRWMKYESGVHRGQRVPTTETQGRIHTSTATVAVLPEAEEVDVVLRPEDLRIEVCRSGGAGGQHVNRTESAVQVFHLPTGVMVRCEDGRSQGKNKEKALLWLRAKLLDRERAAQADAYSENRRKLIGSGGREEKIRTYNFPQSRLTDHRIGLTIHNLDAVMDGNLDEVIDALMASEMQERLEELEREA